MVVDVSIGKTTTEKKLKTLLLECKSREQKEVWYIAIENAIKGAKDPKFSAPNLNFDTEMEVDSDEELIESIKNKKLKGSDCNKRMKIRRVSSEEWGVVPEASSDTLLGVYHDRYESHNFVDQRFEEFGVLEEADSQTSEYDQSFFDKYGTNEDEKNTLSPHRKSSIAKFEDEKGNGLQQIQIKDGMAVTKSPKASAIIIGRSSSEHDLDRVPSIERAPSFSLRLSDSRLTPDEDVVIRLKAIDVKEK